MIHLIKLILQIIATGIFLFMIAEGVLFLALIFWDKEYIFSGDNIFYKIWNINK